MTVTDQLRPRKVDPSSCYHQVRNNRLKIASWKSDHPLMPPAINPLPGLTPILGSENPSATRRVSRLCHCAVTCYYKHVHSLCFSTRSAAKRDMRLTDLNPQSVRPKCQTAAVQKGSVFHFFATKVVLAAETISRYLKNQSMPL